MQIFSIENNFKILIIKFAFVNENGISIESTALDSMESALKSKPKLFIFEVVIIKTIENLKIL